MPKKLRRDKFKINFTLDIFYYKIHNYLIFIIITILIKRGNISILLYKEEKNMMTVCIVIEL